MFLFFFGLLIFFCLTWVVVIRDEIEVVEVSYCGNFGDFDFSGGRRKFLV